MSYNIKYKVEYNTKTNKNIKVNILKKDYTGDVTNIEYINSSISLKYKPSEDAVIGSELSFSFIVKDKAPFLDLIQSNYKDYKAQYYIDGVLFWSGYLVIDNITTSYYDYQYTINLSFADALAELDRYKVTNNEGGEISGRYTLLSWIKNSIKYTDLELDFAIINNTKEVDLMVGVNDNALALASLSSKRFKDVKDGKIEITDAKTVINEILKAFNCKLFQANNKIYIVNELETDSPVHYYAYSDLTQQSVGVNTNSIDLSSYFFDTSNELTKERPLKTATITFLNKNTQESLVENGDFSTTDLSFFTFTGIETAINQGALDILINQPFGSTVKGTITTGLMDVASRSANDIIKLSFDGRLQAIDYDGTNVTRPITNVTFELRVFKNGVEFWYTTLMMQLGTWVNYTYDIPYTEGGDYHVTLTNRTASPTPFYSIEFRMDNLSFIPVFGSSGGVGDAGDVITYDEQFSATNTPSTAIDLDESLEVMVGDGLQKNDISNLYVGNELTARWNTFNRTENLRLQQLVPVNLLRLKQGYRNRLRLTVIANNFLVFDYNTQILFDGKRYKITDYSVTYSTIHFTYSLTLLELFTEDVFWDLTGYNLTSVNGEKAASEIAVTETDPTVGGHIKNITIEDINKWNDRIKTDYELPEASDTVLGGVKVGENLSITDGVLSVDPELVSAVNTATDVSYNNQIVIGEIVTTVNNTAILASNLEIDMGNVITEVTVLGNQISGIDNRVNELNVYIDSVASNSDVISTELSEVVNTVDGISNSISDTVTTVNNLNYTVDSLVSNVDIISTDITEIVNTVDGIGNDLSDINTNVNNLAFTVDVIAQDVADLKANGGGGTGGSDYVLPKATNLTLGGVVVGNNLTIDSNGIVNVPLATANTNGLMQDNDKFKLDRFQFPNEVFSDLKIDGKSLDFLANGIKRVEPDPVAIGRGYNIITGNDSVWSISWAHLSNDIGSLQTGLNSLVNTVDGIANDVADLKANSGTGGGGTVSNKYSFADIGTNFISQLYAQGTSISILSINGQSIASGSLSTTNTFAAGANAEVVLGKYVKVTANNNGIFGVALNPANVYTYRQNFKGLFRFALTQALSNSFVNIGFSNNQNILNTGYTTGDILFRCQHPNSTGWTFLAGDETGTKETAVLDQNGVPMVVNHSLAYTAYIWYNADESTVTGELQCFDMFGNVTKSQPITHSIKTWNNSMAYSDALAKYMTQYPLMKLRATDGTLPSISVKQIITSIDLPN
ncbi:methyl-accepting chemotaxis protein [Rufibacter sp. LB8]|uniref:methyl-accepting chemotaxis protein n=1 Tax=Rufibacter sp. LB8 TaxID=2777781 RepID=UPI00178C56E1|nr:methyl-accepting chemotaxis protein [Rufibacter sp. LB8]